jgi:hypothetical protein
MSTSILSGYLDGDKRMEKHVRQSLESWLSAEVRYQRNTGNHIKLTLATRLLCQYRSDNYELDTLIANYLSLHITNSNTSQS